MMLGAMFMTFLLQIFSRYVLQTPFGWTLEFCLILWVWIVFFGCAFVVTERDHVTFDIFYLAAPPKLQAVFALIAAAAIVIGMLYALLPTLDWINFLKIKKTAVLKIPLRTVYSIYGIFMVVIIIRYGWRFVDIIRNGPPKDDHNIIPDDVDEPTDQNNVASGEKP